MTLRTVLHTTVARGIARKAGLRSVAGDVGEAFSRTLIDAWIDPTFDKECWQWKVDLSGYSAIRFVNRGPLNPNFFLAYSISGFSSSALDPGDYALFTIPPLDPYGYPNGPLEAFSGTSELDGGRPWAQIPENLRIPLRLTFSLGTGGGTAWNWHTTSVGWGSANYAGGFSVGLQVL